MTDIDLRTMRAHQWNRRKRLALQMLSSTIVLGNWKVIWGVVVIGHVWALGGDMAIFA
jgi:hypothetical protein